MPLLVLLELFEQLFSEHELPLELLSGGERVEDAAVDEGFVVDAVLERLEHFVVELDLFVEVLDGLFSSVYLRLGVFFERVFEGSVDFLELAEVVAVFLRAL